MNKKVLNIGCGDSDYGTDRIDICKTSATTKVYDIEKGLPYPSNYFDEIYCRSILEHIKNIGTFASECYRVLKLGGKIWLRTDYAGYLPLHLLKSREHNYELERQYKGKSFGHKKNKDAHYHLFVESHLNKLFSRFKNKKFNYVYGGGIFFLILSQKYYLNILVQFI